MWQLSADARIRSELDPAAQVSFAPARGPFELNALMSHAMWSVPEDGGPRSDETGQFAIRSAAPTSAPMNTGEQAEQHAYR
jgi:hypothetical protein